jgi:transposase
MGQRTSTLARIFGFDGFKVEAHFETAGGVRISEQAAPIVLRGKTLVLDVRRRWRARCGSCGRACSKVHERLKPRRWADLGWAQHPVVIEYAPVRVRCAGCGSTAVELIAWADTHQRQTRRLQHQLAVQSMSMPLSHVAALNGLDWSTVRRAQDDAIERWQSTRAVPPLRQVGVDEKYLGRRARDRVDKFVTIVSDLQTGEPIWIGHGRRQETLARWLGSLSAEQKAGIESFSVDMHEPFARAIASEPGLSHAALVHDPFHVMKRAGEAVDELRRAVLFRASPELRALGRGRRWLFLRPWERLTDAQQVELAELMCANRTLMHAYTVKEQLRDTLRAPTRDDMVLGLRKILQRTARRSNVPMRKLHDSLRAHFDAIVALAQHRPPTGRIEALNNNWETLTRRGRGYRDLHRMLNLLRFMIVNPIRQALDIQRFLAIGAAPPFPCLLAA